MTVFLQRSSLDRDHGDVYFVDGVEVGRANYEEHGSDGMEIAEDLFMRIAKAVGAEFRCEQVYRHQESSNGG